MVVAAVFRGDPAQVRALLYAVERNCTCQSGNCSAHQAILDQRFLDGLLFAAYLHDRLLIEEADRY